MSKPPDSREVVEYDLSWINDAGLTPKQLLFTKEYITDFNASAAYQRCYPETSLPTAGTQGCLLLKNPKVKAAVRRAIMERMAATGIKSDQVLREAAFIAFSDIGDVLDFTKDTPTLKKASDIPEHARRAISYMKVKTVLEKTSEGFKPAEVIEIKFWDKNAALNKCFKHLGLFDADNRQKALASTGPILEEIDSLELPIDVRIALLEAIKKKKERDTTPATRES